MTQKRDYAEAIRVAEPYVQKYPKFPELLDTVGWAHLMNGDAKKAEPILKQALIAQQARDRRVLADIAYHYGEALYRNGKFKEAREVLEPVSRVQFSQSDRVKEILSKMK